MGHTIKFKYSRPKQSRPQRSWLAMRRFEGLGLLFKTMSFQFLCAEVGGWLPLCDQLWNWSHGWTLRHVWTLSLSSPALEDFPQSPDLHHWVTHLSGPCRWAALGGREAGRRGKKSCVLLLEQKAFSPGQRSCCVLAVSSNVPLLQEQWIAPATWKRTILAWMGWTMTCFTLMTLDLQVSLVRWLQLAFSHRTSPTAAFWGGFNYSPSHTAVVPVSGILSSRTRQLKHSARPLPVRMLCCLVESLKSPGDSSMVRALQCHQLCSKENVPLALPQSSKVSFSRTFY